MQAKQVWYLGIGMFPLYGAYSSSQRYGEIWSGLGGGLIVTMLLLGVGEAALFVVRRFSRASMSRTKREPAVPGGKRLGDESGVSNSDPSPYRPPASVVSKDEADVPSKILHRIKQAWVAATVSGVVTLGMTLLSIFVSPILKADAWTLVDVALLLGLAYGIYLRSRVCAVSLLVYFIYAKIYLLRAGASVGSIPVALLFMYFFAQGVIGTVQYHRLAKNA